MSKNEFDKLQESIDGLAAKIVNNQQSAPNNPEKKLLTLNNVATAAAVILGGFLSYTAFSMQTDIREIRAGQDQERTARLDATEVSFQKITDLLTSEKTQMKELLTSQKSELIAIQQTGIAELTTKLAGTNGKVVEFLNGPGSPIKAIVAGEITTLKDDLTSPGGLVGEKVKEFSSAQTETNAEAKTLIESIIATATQEFEASKAAAAAANKNANATLDQINVAIQSAEARDVVREERAKENVEKFERIVSRFCNERAHSTKQSLTKLKGESDLPEKARKSLAVLSNLEEGVISVSSACDELWVIVEFPGSLPETRRGTIDDFASEIGARVLMPRQSSFLKKN